MDFPYTIEDLSSKCKVSKQSIYSLIKKNQEFVKQNSIKRGKKIKYNQAVLNHFLDYYGVKEEEQPSPDAPEDARIAENASIEGEEPSSNTTNEDTAEEKIKALESQIEALKQELAASKEANSELIRQNGQLLLLLQEEKQEKMRLLPAPRKSIGERISNFFKKKT